MFDVIVVGAGAAGCVAARELAEKQNKKVLILEKKNHIAGNCYDEKDEHGVLIHVYGPHIFHTGREKVFEYLSRFTDWYFFHHEVVANVHGKYVPVPFNLHTLKAVYGEEKGNKLEEKLQTIKKTNASKVKELYNALKNMDYSRVEGDKNKTISKDIKKHYAL